MTFKTQMAADATAVFFNTDEFATTIEYLADTGATIATKAIVSQMAAIGPSGWPGGESRVFTVHLMQAAVADPKPGDTFTAEGYSYQFRVAEVLSDDGGVVVLQAVAEQRPRAA